MTSTPSFPSVSEPIWSAVPESLASRQQWLLWRFEFKPGSDKPGKVPYYVMGGRRTGNQGSDQDRQRLGTLAVVRKAYERGSWHGVGFAFLPDDGLIGIDIDGAIDPESGEPNDRCRNIIERCASYTERSPSGQGVHILVEGTTNTNKSNDIGLEVFCGSQFFTFTADRWPETPAEVRPIDESVLRRLHVTIDDAKAQAKAAKQAAARPSSAPPSAAQPVGGGGDDFARTNATAMMALHAWVPSLFPGAIARGDGYRVTSKALGRNLQEDLSIDPKGIVDFGVADMGDARDGKRSPIDLVMEWLPGTSTAAEALRWLAKQLGVELTPPQRPQKPPRANDPAPAGGGQGGGGKGRPPQSNGGDGGDEPSMGPEDVAALLMQNRGKPIDCRENVLYCFEHDPALQGLVKMNEFTGLLERSRETPWGAEPGEWDEEDDLMLGEYLARVYRLIVKATSTLRNGVLMASRKCKFNPVIDTIKTEAWDGIERLESWLSDIYEVEDRPYTRLIGRCFMMGLVKRAIQPGCKFDYMLIIKGEQGLSKSSAFRELAYPYFTDNAIRVGDKDSLMAMQLAWIVESAELESLNKSETTLIKQFLSAQEDLYRPPYGSQMVRKPRHSVNVGTTNADTFLKDSTGDRRFWPLEVFHVNLEVLKSIKHQLLAEALHRVEAGEQYWPTRQEEKDLIFPEQERFKRADPWEDLLDAYVNAQFGEQQTDIPRCDRDFFTTIEIYDKALNIKADRIDGAGQMDTRIGNAMRSLGFERHRESSGRRARGFRRLPPPAAPAQPPAPISGPAGPVEEGHDLPF